MSTQTGIEAAIARVRAFAAAREWTKGRFAREAGLGETTLRDFHAPNWNPTAETLRALEALIPTDFLPVADDGAAKAA